MGYVMCMNTVIDRSRLPEILSFYQSRGIMVNFITLCQGTAALCCLLCACVKESGSRP